jgi:hopene-associated glycosyltransferase HpnB
MTLHLLADLLAAVALAAWLYLLAGRGAFWLAAERDDRNEPAPPRIWPRITAVIPARNEAQTIAKTIGSLLRQDYPGALSVILVDDESQDGTADIARQAAVDAPDRLTVLRGQPVPDGWTGKLWAVNQGVTEALAGPSAPDYLLLTDADIVYAPDAVARIVARAEAGGYVLTSLMAKLRCQSWAERCFVPAFIFFFQMLYPFAWVNRRARATAAAAGGCMLVRPAALQAAGGIGRIRGALIDDCALGAALKAQGPVWLGLTERVHSIRPYDRWSDIRAMVARSAYAQLRHSPLLLLATVLGMTLIFMSGPLLAALGSGSARVLGVLVWGAEALSFQPILRFYRRSPLWGIALPVIAFVYVAFTIDSAYQHGRGRGGMWKGRVQAKVVEQR